jgi:hypothetical protein
MQTIENQQINNLKPLIKKSVKDSIPGKKLKAGSIDDIDHSSLSKAIDEGMQTESIEKIIFIKKLMSRIQ